MRLKTKVVINAKQWEQTLFLNVHELDDDKKVKDYPNSRNKMNLVIRMRKDTMVVSVTMYEATQWCLSICHRPHGSVCDILMYEAAPYIGKVTNTSMVLLITLRSRSGLFLKFKKSLTFFSASNSCLLKNAACFHSFASTKFLATLGLDGIIC
ncbi:hypothetical protein DM860_012328 [Cuscuta australis]|uniref:Uncharacterized protein n=1 Tax=Cuscuta australis TaxID=267555 RepID=A0A328DUG4_9ASTE|nr:hypothetical protein DM860_012328 [Cuscuta australis]